MATRPSLHATPEHWTELIAARRQRRLCAEQVEAIKSSCRAQCGKRHITECGPCYGKALERMRRRYNEGAGREWFTQRKAFLQELDGLFSDAKKYRKSMKSIEARIDSEKEAWYRWVLRRHPQFLAVRDGGVHQDELRGMLDDPDRSRDELVGMMWQGIGKPPDWAERVDSLADRVEGAKDETELKKLYVGEFFLDQKTGEVLKYAQPYLQEYEGDRDAKLESIVAGIADKAQESRRVQPRRESHILRLNDLRRAKTAFELNKVQAKSRVKAREAAASHHLHDLPPCAVCSKPANVNDILSCSVCQAVTQTGGPSKLTIYCSEECYSSGHEKHIETEHDCEAGTRCVQLLDEDVVMGDDGLCTFACKECFGQKQSAVFCSERCASENIAGHRRRMHGLMTGRGEVQALIGPLTEVVGSILQKENPDLEMKMVQG